MFTLRGVVKAHLTDDTRMSKNNNEYRVGTCLIVDGDKEYCMTVFGSIIDNLVVGSEYDITFDIRSKEFKGKYYTNLTINSVVLVGAKAEAVKQPEEASSEGDQYASSPVDTKASPICNIPSQEYDLPF